MAIREVDQKGLFDKKDALYLEVDNGDLEALKEIVDKWNFKDKPSVFRFCLAVLKKSEDQKVSIKEGDKSIILTPNDSLLAKPEIEE